MLINFAQTKSISVIKPDKERCVVIVDKFDDLNTMAKLISDQIKFENIQ